MRQTAPLVMQRDLMVRLIGGLCSFPDEWKRHAVMACDDLYFASYWHLRDNLQRGLVELMEMSITPYLVQRVVPVLNALDSLSLHSRLPLYGWSKRSSDCPFAVTNTPVHDGLLWLINTFTSAIVAGVIVQCSMGNMSVLVDIKTIASVMHAYLKLDGLGKVRVDLPTYLDLVISETVYFGRCANITGAYFGQMLDGALASHDLTTMMLNPGRHGRMEGDGLNDPMSFANRAPKPNEYICSQFQGSNFSLDDQKDPDHLIRSRDGQGHLLWDLRWCVRTVPMLLARLVSYQSGTNTVAVASLALVEKIINLAFNTAFRIIMARIVDILSNSACDVSYESSKCVSLLRMWLKRLNDSMLAQGLAFKAQANTQGMALCHAPFHYDLFLGAAPAAANIACPHDGATVDEWCDYFHSKCPPSSLHSHTLYVNASSEAQLLVVQMLPISKRVEGFLRAIADSVDIHVIADDLSPCNLMSLFDYKSICNALGLQRSWMVGVPSGLAEVWLTGDGPTLVDANGVSGSFVLLNAPSQYVKAMHAHPAFLAFQSEFDFHAAGDLATFGALFVATQVGPGQSMSFDTSHPHQLFNMHATLKAGNGSPIMSDGAFVCAPALKIAVQNLPNHGAGEFISVFESVPPVIPLRNLSLVRLALASASFHLLSGNFDSSFSVGVASGGRFMYAVGSVIEFDPSNELAGFRCGGVVVECADRDNELTIFIQGADVVEPRGLPILNTSALIQKPFKIASTYLSSSTSPVAVNDMIMVVRLERSDDGLWLHDRVRPPPIVYATILVNVACRLLDVFGLLLADPFEVSSSIQSYALFCDDDDDLDVVDFLDSEKCVRLINFFSWRMVKYLEWARGYASNQLEFYAHGLKRRCGYVAFAVYRIAVEYFRGGSQLLSPFSSSRVVSLDNFRGLEFVYVKSRVDVCKAARSYNIDLAGNLLPCAEVDQLRVTNYFVDAIVVRVDVPPLPTSLHAGTSLPVDGSLSDSERAEAERASAEAEQLAMAAADDSMDGSDDTD